MPIFIVKQKTGKKTTFEPVTIRFQEHRKSRLNHLTEINSLQLKNGDDDETGVEDLIRIIITTLMVIFFLITNACLIS